MCLSPVTLESGQIPCSTQRSGSHCRSCSSSRQREHSFQPGSSLAKVPTNLPEPPECYTEAQGLLYFLMCNKPAQCGPQVPLLSIQPSQPQKLLLSPEVWLCLLCQCKVIAGMSTLDVLFLSILPQTIQPEFVHGHQPFKEVLCSLLLA